jgi:hypothetical protein
MSDCPKGSLRRRGYTRKNGVVVKSACISSRKGTRRVCPPGQIARSGYLRKISTRIHTEGYNRKTKTGKIIRVRPKTKTMRVKSACIKDVGKKGKASSSTPRIGPLRKGDLKKYGYSYKLPETRRHAALKSAVREYGPLGVYHKLNAVAKLTTISAPSAHSAFSKDRNWIRIQYANASGTIRAS